MKKCAVITGSSRGIGKSTAVEFAKHGYDVIVHYVTHEEEAINLQKELEKNFQIKVSIIQADFSKEEEIERFCHEVKSCYSEIDVLVNNAGIAIDCMLEDKTKENFIKTLEVNTIAPFLISRSLAPIIKENGSIIMISSTNGIDTTYVESLDYDVSKAGLISLTHNLALAYAPKIRVNAVAPGWVNTNMNDLLDEDFCQEEVNKILLNRFAVPEEIAKVVYFLASDEASYINDTVIRVDGGCKR